MLRTSVQPAVLRGRRATRVLAVALALVAGTLTSGVATAGNSTGNPGGDTESLSILLTNDDGYAAPTIETMAAALTAAGHEVTIVAPCTDMSGAGTSFTADYYAGGPKKGHTIKAVRVSEDTWKVCGTPADSVYFALQHVFTKPPDLVVSGVNPGQNIGAIANHSGTVGAVITALEFGIPGIAISAAYDLRSNPRTPPLIAEAARFTVRLIERLQRSGLDDRLLPEHIALNVNYPAAETPSGINVTRQGAGSFVTPRYVPAEEVCANCYLITPGLPDDRETVRDADTTAIANGQISITPLNGYWTAGPVAGWRLRWVLRGMEPVEAGALETGSRGLPARARPMGRPGRDLD